MKRCVLFLLLVGCSDPMPRRERIYEGRQLADAVPPGNIRVQIETYEFDTTDVAAFGVAVRYADEDVGIEGAAGWRTNGLRIFAVSANFSAEFALDTRNYKSRRNTTASLLVADGYEGSLDVVQEIPVQAVTVIPIYRGAVVLRTLEIVPVGSGFAVRPRSVDASTVDIALTPWLRDFRRGAIEVTELSTQLRVPVGRPIVIMQHESREQTIGTFFFSSGARRRLMVLTVMK